MQLKSFSILAFSLGLFACASAPQQPKKVWAVSVNGQPVPVNNDRKKISFERDALRAQAAAPEKEKEKTSEDSGLVEKVWVWRPDGSKQCGMAKGIKPKEAAKRLKDRGVSVFKSRTGNDGMMHMTVCGGATGHTVELLIGVKDLEKVKKWGFLEKQSAAKQP